MSRHWNLKQTIIPNEAEQAFIKSPPLDIDNYPFSTAGYSGSSVDISKDGSTLAIGGWDHNYQSGIAWVYAKNEEIWELQETFFATAADNAWPLFGYSVALSETGDTLCVGAIWDGDQDGHLNSAGHQLEPDSAGANADEVGKVYIFDRIGTSWSATDVLTPASYNFWDEFGFSVDINDDGTRIVVGDPIYCFDINTRFFGSINIYELISGTWTNVGQFTPDDADVGTQGSSLTNNWVDAGTSYIGIFSIGPGFGYSVSFATDNKIVVGGPNNGGLFGGGIRAGGVWTFVRSGGIWSQTIGHVEVSGKLQLGTDISACSSRMVAISSHSSSIHDDINIFDASGDDWIYSSTETGDTTQGTAVETAKISEDGNIIVSGPGLAASGFGSRSTDGIKVIQWDSDTSDWVLQQTISDGATVGQTVAISSGAEFIVGGDPTTNSTRGSTKIYESFVVSLDGIFVPIHGT